MKPIKTLFFFFSFILFMIFSSKIFCQVKLGIFSGVVDTAKKLKTKTENYNKPKQPNQQYNVNIVWQKSFAKESPAYDSYGIAIDSNGNIYTSGYTTSTVTGKDFLVNKFDKDGNLLWSVKFDSGPSDLGMNISPDQSGNFFVTGQSWNNTGWNWDILTIKFKPNGETIWQKKYNGGDADGGFGIAVDQNSGSVYVSGTSSRGVNSDDIILIKYDTNGNTVWISTYNAGVKDHGYSVALDKDGNVYICGYVLNGTNMTYDYILIKYDKDGNLLWHKVYDSSYNDNAIGVAVDSSNNIYVTGQTYNGSNYDYLTIKYDSNGNPIWKKVYDTGKDDLGYAIALDKYGSVYVTGQTGHQNNNSTFDFLTIKYDTDGNFCWEKTYDGGLLDGGYAIAVDEEGFVYVLGQTQVDSSNYNYLLIKYKQY